VSHAIPHSFPIGIDPADIDFMGHVNNASYLKWVQDAVVSHWQRFAPAEAIAANLWVALKHEITYRKPTFLLPDDHQARRGSARRGAIELVLRRCQDPPPGADRAERGGLVFRQGLTLPLRWTRAVGMSTPG
jgi:hypothetical protein